MKRIIGCFSVPITGIHDLVGKREFELLVLVPGQCVGPDFHRILRPASGLIIGAPAGPEALAVFFEAVACNERFSMSPKFIAIIAPEDGYVVSSLDPTMISLFLLRGALPSGASRYVKVFVTAKEAIDWLADGLMPKVKVNGHKVPFLAPKPESIVA